MNMTEQQVQAVKTSWRLFQDINPVLVGEVFYGKLFMSNPRLRHLFTHSIEEQSEKLMHMLSMIVARLDRPKDFENEVKQLAIRHVNYGVKPEHYKLVGDALLWTLQQGLGKDWTPVVKEAWVACYKQLSEMMIGVAYKSQK